MVIIVKSSKAGSAFFNGLISAQGASPDQLVDVDFPSSTYSRWYGPGFGVNDDGAVNDPGTTITIPSDTSKPKADAPPTEEAAAAKK